MSKPPTATSPSEAKVSSPTDGTKKQPPSVTEVKITQAGGGTVVTSGPPPSCSTMVSERDLLHHYGINTYNVFKAEHVMRNSDIELQSWKEHYN